MPKLSPVKNPQIQAWRFRARRFKQLRKEISEILLKKGFSKEMTQLWLKTPSPDLDGKTPRELLNPFNIVRLHAHAKRALPNKV